MPALYRQYRPRTFDAVAGQEHITRTLKNQVAADRPGHAYLFVGTRGTGKTSCAKILARAINCENPTDGNPCNSCASCRSIEDGTATDVLEIDAASNNGVDNVRALRDEAIFTPAAVRRRVYIIDEAHMLSVAAFNALLKILEEPPAHLVFILATTELHKVPATVLSRCQRYSFRRLSRETIGTQLKSIAAQEEFHLDDEAAATLARLADGSMRDGISLLDQCSGGGDVSAERVREVVGLPSLDAALRLMIAVAERDAAEAFTLLDELYSAGRGISALFEELADMARDALVTLLLPGSSALLTGVIGTKELNELAKKLGRARLLHVMAALTRTQSDFNGGAGDRLAAEICLAMLCDERLDNHAEAVAARLDALEQSTQNSASYAPEAQSEPTKPQPKKRENDKKPTPKPAAHHDAPPWDEPPEVPARPAPKPVEIPEPTAPFDDAPPWDEPDEAPPQPVETFVAATPIPDPAAPPAPVSEPQEIVTNAEDYWSGILRRLDNAAGMMIMPFLREASAGLSGDMLTVTVSGQFHADMLGRESAAELIKSAAEQELGRPIGLRTVVGDTRAAAKTAEPSAASPLNRLDRLASQFGGIVEFE